jgi:hypothetical protein
MVIFWTQFVSSTYIFEWSFSGHNLCPIFEWSAKVIKIFSFIANHLKTWQNVQFNKSSLDNKIPLHKTILCIKGLKNIFFFYIKWSSLVEPVSFLKMCPVYEWSGIGMPCTRGNRPFEYRISQVLYLNGHCIYNQHSKTGQVHFMNGQFKAKSDILKTVHYKTGHLVWFWMVPTSLDNIIHKGRY